MDPYVAADIATAVASALLGLVAYLRAPDRHSNRLFAVHAGCVTAWALGTYAIQFTRDPVWLALLFRLVHVVGAYVVVTFVDFVWVFPDRLRPAPRRHRVWLHLSVLLAVVSMALPAAVTRVEVRAGVPQVALGWPLLILATYVGALLVYLNIVLWRKVRTLRGVARLQIIYVLAGTVVSESIMSVLLLVLPLVTEVNVTSRWGVVSYLITVAAIGIAIAKHRLWDLSSLERRAAAAMLALGTLVPVGAAVIWVLVGRGDGFVADPLRAAIVWVVLGAVLGTALTPVYSAFRGLFVRPLQEDRDRIGQLLGALGTAIVHSPSGGATLLPMLVQAQRFFGASFVEAYLRRPTGVYQHAGTVDPDAAAPHVLDPHRRLPASVIQGLAADALVEPLDAEQLARFGPVATATQQLGAMEAIGATVVVPLRWQEATIGLLVMGPKLSRDMYRASDLDLLTSVAAHAAIATRNAELRDQIIAEKERTEKVLTQLENGVVVVDGTRTIRLVNPAACHLLASGESALVGNRTSVLPGQLQILLDQAVAAGTTVSGERVYLDYRRQLRVACSTFVLRGPTGSCEGAGTVFRDLRTEDALHQVERETERLRFIRAVSAGMAHEIRNPLVAIRTFAELAPRRLDDPEFRESFVKVAQSEITRLEDLVSQFMTLARPTRLVREPVDLAALFESVVTAVWARAQADEVAIVVDLPPTLPRPRGDGPRLYQALFNLLLNALDATPRGGRIELSARAEALGAGEPGEVRLRVWNSSSYIPPEHLERVFEPFFTSKASGTGLGLAICKTIADEHGGTTIVESYKDAGTAFTLRIPIISAYEALAEAPS